MSIKMQMTTRPSPATKSILKPSRLGGTVSPFTSIIRNRSIPNDLPSDWREEGENLRFGLLKGDIHNEFSITHSIPMENYLEIIHRVQEQFNCSYNRKTNLEQTYIIGNRILVFLSKVLPSHEDYQLEKNKVMAITIENDIQQLRQRLADVALWIDLDLYYSKNDPFGGVNTDDVCFHTDERDEQMRSNTSITKKVTFSDEISTLAIQSTIQDFGDDNNGCPASNTSNRIGTACVTDVNDTDQSLGKLNLWINRDPDLDITNMSSSSDGSSFSEYDSQNWPTFESLTQTDKNSSFTFETSPFPQFDSPGITSKQIVTKIPPPTKESNVKLKRNQRRRKLKSLNQTTECISQDCNDQKTAQDKSSPTSLFDMCMDINSSHEDFENDFGIDSHQFDAFQSESGDFSFDPIHPSTEFGLSDMKRDLFGANNDYSTTSLQYFNANENYPLPINCFADAIDKETCVEEEMPNLNSSKNHDGKNGLTRDLIDSEEEQISSSFSEWDNSFVSESNLSFDNRFHSRNDKQTSLDSADDIDHAEDNVIRSKNELFSDDFSQSIDSSRFSKSTSSTAETDTMTTEDDVEASLYRVSKMSDCDVGCELDYLESKVKDLKIKQDHYGSHAILSTTRSSNIPGKPETTITDLKSRKGRIMRLKSPSTPTKISAQLSYENDRNSPHDEMDELDLASSFDVHTKKKSQTDNCESPPLAETKNGAKTSCNLTASRLRALKATSAWKRRYGTKRN